MSEAYAREVLRRNVAQICQTIGWNGINSSPLDILVHILEKYIHTLGTQANRYAEQFNRTEPNLHDLGLVLRDLHVQLPELAEYARCVPPVPPPVNVENFPRPKETNLNFLKPGSHEVVTRPVHVHEHLPPMYPEKERDTPIVADTIEIRQNGIENDNNSTASASPEISVTDSPEKPKELFKRPIDPVSLPNSKRPRLRLDEEERTREISSVMMTMSGFLSPAREGKLPEARPPTIISEKHYERHKANLHHSLAPKIPAVEKSDKKSKKNKLLNGKIMKSKRKEKTHKSESNKSKERHPPGHSMKNKDIHPTHHNHITMPAPKHTPPPTPPKPVMPPPPAPPGLDVIKPAVKQEAIEHPQSSRKNNIPEDTIPVPRKIPISESPLVSNSIPVNKHSVTNSLISETEIKKELVDEEEKLASQPDRSKINIFKRISNKSKEDKSNAEVVDSSFDTLISRLQNSAFQSSSEKPPESLKGVADDPIVNNNDNRALDLSIPMDLKTTEVINIDDDSMDHSTTPQAQSQQLESRPNITINKSLQVPFPKEVAKISPKIKKDRKPREKKDKTGEKLSKLEAKLLKRQQQQLAFEMAQIEKQTLMATMKPPKSSRPRNEPKLPQMPPGFPFFPAMAPGRGLMSGPGLIPNHGLIPSSDFLAGLAGNPALRGLPPPPNLLTNPFSLGGPPGPGLIPGSNFLPGNLGPAIPNSLMSMGNFPHSSRSSSKIPPVLRRPSLEVIPVDNEDDRSTQKSSGLSRDRDRHDKHKSPTIPNILQKPKFKSHKEHKSNIYKMPPIHPDITIELNPPKIDPVRQEPPPKQILQPVCVPSPEPIAVPNSELQIKQLEVPDTATIDITQESQSIDDKSEKKKDKSHKKEKKDKDGIKIKKKKDKKDKNKEKSDKKREKEEKHELKDRIKKEKKEKRKEKTTDGLVPKLTLKLGSSNSNSPMPPSSPDTFKLNIKPIVKKEEDENSSAKDDPISREHSHSPELAQISALVTRPPKQKHIKHNHVSEIPPSPPSSGSSPPRKNHPPSSQGKYKRILFKPLAKKGHVEHFDEEVVEASGPPSATPQAVDKPSGTLPTPYYVDEQGNKIWVCPACGRPDNGSPMIGCDGCDGWYHWVCVGITEEPGATEDWFCKSCIAKRAAMVLAGVATTGKKRGRKPKAEKNRDCH